ncbi:MAG TPA: anaerobic ribonucleoside-triphosphate reductase [Clostridia bacterium]|nr:anaerobic ribonucleoside-triphosphate reductase [Clostridia bacterium]
MVHKKTIRKRRDEVLDRAIGVERSDETLQIWDRNAITKSLKKELGSKNGFLEEVAEVVEKQIFRMELSKVTSHLVRELVCVELLRRGREDLYQKYRRLGIPLYVLNNIILAHNEAVSSNNPHTPETTNMTIAGSMKKDYALSEIYSKEITQSHLKGDIHLHKLDFPDRPYCCGNSLEYIKKYGLNAATSLALTKPAKHAEVLILHMIKFSGMLQIHFSGAIGWEAVNIFLAPYLVGMSDKELYDIAQMLVYEFNNQNVAKGGQAVFSDINLYWEVPDHYRDTPAIGPGGVFTGKTYADYEKEAQRFLTQLMRVYLKGDDGGSRPFFWPKPDFHMTERFWQTPGHKEFLELACEVAAKMGNTEFFFDRGQVTRISQCCRLSFKLDKQDLAETEKPWLMRHSATSWVTVNLPRIAYEAKHDEKKLFKLLKKRMDLAAKAHLQKRRFIKRLLNLGLSGPLAALCTRQPDDPYPYYRFDRSVELTTIYGVNEMVKYHLGKELHESDEALKFGLKVVAFMNRHAQEQSKKLAIRICTEQTPAEGTSYRLAKLDLQWFPQEAGKVVMGNHKTGSVYYTNSSQLNNSVEIDPFERIYKEGMFHPMIDAGAMTHIWLGEQKPSAASIANFVKKTFYETQCELVAFSPEFTLCNDCRATTRGLKERCGACRSKNVDHMTRVSGFYSLTSRWNKGKMQELKDRYRNERKFV